MLVDRFIELAPALYQPAPGPAGQAAEPAPGASRTGVVLPAAVSA
jgi:hypothetical protein